MDAQPDKAESRHPVELERKQECPRPAAAVLQESMQSPPPAQFDIHNPLVLMINDTQLRALLHVSAQHVIMPIWISCRLR
jgi:hypothetical protein